MSKIMLLAILLLPTLALAQPNQEECLVNQTNGNRLSGTVEYVSYEHPHRDVTIAGYKLILLKPRCFEHISLETDEPVRGTITEIAIQNGGSYAQFLKDHIGKTVTLTGEIENHLTIYYVTTPQIYAGSIVACEVTPKSKSTAKC